MLKGTLKEYKGQRFSSLKSSTTYLADLPSAEYQPYNRHPIMAENEIQIEKLDSGKYIAVLQYGTTKVSCANGTSPTLTDYARNAIRLIKQAVDLGWFPNTTQIRVM